ncbi:F1F0 ATP synthase subunit h ASCRUDRAFT_75039 [Ascoidea rubescens DSM 1968]|uniref:Uncharacterized protein n=1 Tax=Ascoidea rubescens DSM 1968 TaxID=1344418 RepID=A0A1D2VJE6_9ASCO|nr:hypothetical protein ASCRUDRAFT_75039 [Ascoidea rubescens DSM 1968]ODV61746.1 hypothetical protein ASCRUDRAFT_75039 [Ascoidea rubescens DSM 1968]
MLSQISKSSIRTLSFQNVAIRSFSSSMARRNLLQDLYINELKAYKPTPLSAADAEGNVKPFTLPAAPKVPSPELDLSTDLDAFKAQAVETESATHEVSASSENAADDWFVLEELPSGLHHH